MRILCENVRSIQFSFCPLSALLSFAFVLGLRSFAFGDFLLFSVTFRRQLCPTTAHSHDPTTDNIATTAKMHGQSEPTSERLTEGKKYRINFECFHTYRLIDKVFRVVDDIPLRIVKLVSIELETKRLKTKRKHGASKVRERERGDH